MSSQYVLIGFTNTTWSDASLMLRKRRALLTITLHRRAATIAVSVLPRHYSMMPLRETLLLYYRVTIVSKRRSTRDVSKPVLIKFRHHITNIHYCNNDILHIMLIFPIAQPRLCRNLYRWCIQLRLIKVPETRCSPKQVLRITPLYFHRLETQTRTVQKTRSILMKEDRNRSSAHFLFSATALVAIKQLPFIAYTGSLIADNVGPNDWGRDLFKFTA